MYQKEKVKVTFGLSIKNKDYYGIMMYHKNRLIKAYEKVGCQLKVEGKNSCVKCSIHGNLPSLQSHFTMSYRLQVREQESGSSVSSSVTFSNRLTTSKTLNTPKNTGPTHTYKTNTQTDVMKSYV